MVEWVDHSAQWSEGKVLDEIYLDTILDDKGLHGSVCMCSITVAERSGFKSVIEAKQWCESEARRILTEALEKLDG